MIFSVARLFCRGHNSYLVVDAAATGCMVMQPCTAIHAEARSCRSHRRESSRACSVASTWSTPTTATSPAAVFPLLLLLLVSSSAAEAAGLWGMGSGGRVGQPQRGSSTGPDDDGMDEIFAKIQQDQFWAEVEHTGMEVLEDEVAEKKRSKVFVEVAKACSIGAQMTLIMGGGAFLFRLIPVLLGHEHEDEEVEAAFPYLLQSNDASGRSQQALPAAAGGAGVGGQQRLLTSGRKEQPNEDTALRLKENEEGGGGSRTANVFGAAAEDEGEGGGVIVFEVGGRGAAVVATGDGEDKEECEEEVGDGDVVVDTPTRAALRKLRRLSRPFFKAIAPPLVLLLVARLTLGRLLARRIDPTLELLFGDDITDLYSVKKKVVEEVNMPFPVDAEGVPGRKKMKGRRVQRLSRPEDEPEEGGEEDGWDLQSEAAGGVL